MRAHRLPALRVVVLLVGLVTGVSLAESRHEARQLKVGVVDLAAVFRKYDRTREADAQIGALRDEIDREGKRIAVEIENLRKELAAGAPGWQLRREELKLKAKEFEVRRELYDERMKLATDRLRLQLLDEIESAIREFGEKNSFDLILKSEGRGWGSESHQEREQKAHWEAIAFHSSKLEVTGDVLAILNDPEVLKKRAPLK